MKTFDEGGKGRKQCPQCQKFVAAPAAKCVCGHVFYEKKPKEKREADDQGPIATRPAQAISTHQNHANLQRVSIPGSPPKDQPYCPAKPKGEWPHTDREIEQWVKDVIDGGKARGLLYLPEAVRYFATSCYWPPYHSGVKKGTCPEHERAKLLAFQYAVEEHKLAAWYRRQDREFEDDAPDGI